MAITDRKRNRRRSPRIFGIASRFLLLIAAGLLAMSYLSVLVNPVKAWFLTIFGLLFVPFFLLNLFLLVWALVRRSRAFAIPLIALLPSLWFLGGFVRFGGDETETDDGGIGMMSYNVGRFSPQPRRGIPTRSACLDSVASYIMSGDMDIICLQEFYVPYPETVKQEIERHFHGYEPVYYMYSSEMGMYGNVILSRLPVMGKGAVEFDESSNLAIYADILTSEGIRRIYNCHLESYSLSFTALVKSLRRDYHSAIQETGRKMRASITRRPAQVARVLEDIARSPVPSMVCGDLNDSPVSYTYYHLQRGRRDSFRDAGRGMGASYSILWPLLRIDYIFYPGDMRASEHRTVRKHWSDHYPIITRIHFNK